MTRRPTSCPYCTAVLPTRWEWIGHMHAAHPDVLARTRIPGDNNAPPGFYGRSRS